MCLYSEPEWEFMKQLEDIEGQERQKAVFECDVSDPEAEVSWFRDEKVRSKVIWCLSILVARENILGHWLLCCNKGQEFAWHSLCTRLSGC